jgi:hypothetical protein
MNANMETPANLMEKLSESVEAYSRTTFELTKLKALQTTAIVVPSLVSHFSVVPVVFLFALVLNVGIALCLGDLLGKNYHGFFVVAAFNLVAASVLHFLFPGWIRTTVSDLIIKEALG